MIDRNTQFFIEADYFKETAHIPSTPIISTEMEAPLLTIAIPTYKRASLLKETLDSALNQEEYQAPYEILVVDNNPERNDETECLLKGYANQSNLSYYKNTENLGMFGNWNRLYTLAKGKWVVMLHDDDLLSPHFLHRMIPLLNEDVNLLACRYKKMRNGEILKAKHMDSSVEVLSLIDFAWGNCTGAPVGVIMQKEKVIQSGGFNPQLYPASDYDMFARMARSGKILILNEHLTIYRMECNASLRTEVLDGFMRTNYYLSNAIWRECGVPRWLYKGVEICRIKKQFKSLRRNWNRSYISQEIPPTNNLLLYWFSYLLYKTVYPLYIKLGKRLKWKYF